MRAKTMINTSQAFNLRNGIRGEDIAAVNSIVTSSGFFTPDEIRIAGELAEEALVSGAASGYFFIFADVSGQPAGYACYGPDENNPRKFHLYWIAVHENMRGSGLGSALIEAAEHEAWAAGAEFLAVETSSRAQYQPTRNFYESQGYTRKSAIRNHYGPGDHLLLYVKPLSAPDFPAPEEETAWNFPDV